MDRKSAYRSVFGPNNEPIGAFASLPAHVTLPAATRQSGDATYEKATIAAIPTGTVHYDDALAARFPAEAKAVLEVKINGSWRRVDPNELWERLLAAGVVS